MRKLIAAGVLLVAAIAVFGFVFGSRDNRITPSIIQTGPERTPAFAFAVGRSGALPTANPPGGGFSGPALDHGETHSHRSG